MFEEILVQDPGNRDALFGLGRVLFWQGHYEQSLETFGRLLAAFPNDKEAIEERDVVLRAKEATTQITARVAFVYESLSFTSDAHGTNFLFTYEKHRDRTVWAGFTYLDKFGENASGLTLGVSYWPTAATVVSLETEQAPGQAVIPRQAYTVEINRIVFKVLVPSLRYQFAEYAAADVHLFMPGVTWYLHPQFDWMARYYFSVTTLAGQTEDNHSGMTRINWHASEGVTFFLGYARSNERFDSGNPVAPVARFSADHVFTGLRADIAESVSLDFTFDYEERDNGFTLKTFNTGLSYRW